MCVVWGVIGLVDEVEENEALLPSRLRRVVPGCCLRALSSYWAVCVVCVGVWLLDREKQRVGWGKKKEGTSRPK